MNVGKGVGGGGWLDGNVMMVLMYMYNVPFSGGSWFI